MKAIMYHYVRKYRSSHPNFRFLDVVNFCKQLDHFEQHYGFATKEDWELAIKNKSLGSAKGKILLTFDDAMSCHFNYVFPELKKRNLWGIFYVPTQPYTNGKILDVHRIQLLCGALKGDRLLKILFDFLTDKMIPDEKIKAFKNETYKRQSNYEGVSEFKRILNFYVSYEFRHYLIDTIAKKVGYEFDTQGFYVSKSDLKEMSLYGNIIGAHTVTHPVMSKLSRPEQCTEIKNLFAFLEDIGCKNRKTYCHPYGGFHSFNDDTIQILHSEKVEYSFNVESRDIEDCDLNSSLQYLPRFNCNQFPFGKAS